MNSYRHFLSEPAESPYLFEELTRIAKMSSENFDAKWTELSKAMAKLKDQTKECREALDKTESMSDEALEAKITALKSSNEEIKNQMKLLDAEEKNIEEKYRSMVQFKFVQESISDHRDSERMEFGAKITDLGAEMEINNLLIKSLEDSRREKSGGSEAK